MIRIFLGLVFVNVVSMAVTAALGWDFDPRATGPPYHWHAGLWTSVLTLLVHSIVLTYFIGTGRWVREVSQAYDLGPSWHDRSWKTKRQSLPFAIGSMLLIIVAAASGAAADPGATVRLKGWMGWEAAHLHLLGALVAMAFNAVSYVIEFRAIREHTTIIEDVMHEVQRVRSEAGMEHESGQPSVSESAAVPDSEAAKRAMRFNRKGSSHDDAN